MHDVVVTVTSTCTLRHTVPDSPCEAPCMVLLSGSSRLAHEKLSRAGWPFNTTPTPPCTVLLSGSSGLALEKDARVGWLFNTMSTWTFGRHASCSPWVVATVKHEGSAIVAFMPQFTLCHVFLPLFDRRPVLT